jgi:hypothetical protein
MLWGQPLRINNNIPVQDLSGRIYDHAWAGGNNTPQYSDVDLDLDGKKDLVVFNPEGRTFSTFINTGGPNQIRYRHDPRYESRFDSCRACVDFALLADYNCDGREDVICGRNSGSFFQVLEQVVYNGDSVGFELRYDPVLVYYPGSALVGYMNQTRTDIPALVDVDYDGDLDVISSQIGSTTWGWYRNYAVERYGRCDTLDMVLEQTCWGHFREGQNDNSLILADTFNCPQGVRDGRFPTDPAPTRHVGDALLAFDSNGDSLMELLIGDVSYPTAVLAINHGTLEDALMTEASYRYPQADSSINVPMLPAFYHLDVDNDGKRDLVVAPNNESLQENVNGTVLYLNYGTDTEVDFRFQGRSFGAAQQVDVGRSSVPVFFDYNQDGLLDLLVAGERATWATNDSLMTDEVFASLRLFQNTGTTQAPSYRLVDSNYLNLNAVFPPIDRVSPALGDLDGDGDLDLILGTGSGKIRHYVNMAANGSPANFVPATSAMLKDDTGADIGSNFSFSSPDLFDFDGDGDLDLFSGNRFGEVIYYENIGTPTQPNFRLITEYFGKIRLRANPRNPIDMTSNSYSKPRFIDHDQDGIPSLLIGSHWGYLEIFDQYALGLTDSLIRDGLFLDHDFGQQVTPTAAVIDGTEALTWIMGNSRGGLLLVNAQPYDTTSPSPVSIQPEPGRAVPDGFRLYPNPTNGVLHLEFMAPSSSTPVDLALVNHLGQTLRQTRGEGQHVRWDLSTVSAGLYLVRIRWQGQQWVEKVWIR